MAPLPNVDSNLLLDSTIVHFVCCSPVLESKQALLLTSNTAIFTSEILAMLVNVYRNFTLVQVTSILTTHWSNWLLIAGSKTRA